MRKTLLIAGLFMFAACSHGDSFPNRPIVLISPWAAGGGTDRMARQIAPYLEKGLGYPVNVINATGGAGVTGHARGAGARPDGHTVTMMTVELNMLHWRDLTDISWIDFEPIGMINSDAAALIVRREDFENRWRNPTELLGWIRDNPGQLHASGTATGGIWHLALAGLLESEGLASRNINWIPMNGAGPSLQELVAGGVDLVCCSLPEARTLLEAGEVSCVGVMARERVAGYENVPTLQEFGISWTSPAWRALGLPKGTPEAIVDRYISVVSDTLEGELLVNQRSFPEIMRNQGFDITWQPGEEFKSTLARLDRELGKLLKSEAFSSVSRGPVRPYAFPSLLIGALIALLTGAAVQSLLRPEKHLSRQSLWRLQPLTRIGEVVLLTGLFVLVVEQTGFVIAGILLLSYLLLRNGVNPGKSLLIPLILIPLIYQIFANFLRVPLARGWLGW